MRDAHHKPPAGKLRARGAGIPFPGTPGTHNAITDVHGVNVGYCTLIEGEGPLVVGKGPIRTGVTAIFPMGRARPDAAVFAGCFVMGGNGEMTGLPFIEERGRFEGPITLTNTHSCGIARDTTAAWLSAQVGTDRKEEPFWLPVAGETYDGFLNDINGHHVKPEHVIAAFESAGTGPLEEGSVGGGTGMSCYQFKGGSGTASRLIPYENRTYTVGTFVQSNFGKRHLLTIAGIPIGPHFPLEEDPPTSRGSIISIVATDAPLLPHQLNRIARRSSYGIARSGGIASNESGDLFLAFSTANSAVMEHHHGLLTSQFLGEGALSLFYEAAIEAMDEAIMNSIFANDTMTGRDGHTVPGLPIEEVCAILKHHNRLSVV